MNNRIHKSEKIRVCHLASGDLWAGAEVQIAMLLAVLSRYQDLELSVILLNHGRLAEKLERDGIRVVIFDETKFSSLQILKMFYDYFSQCLPDIIHAHGYKAHILGCIAAKLSGIKYIVKTVHGLEELFPTMKRLKASFYTHLDTLFDKYFTDKIIAVSYNVHQELSKRINSRRIVTIHNGIELNRVCLTKDPVYVRRKLCINAEDFIVGTVGRLVPVKGQEYFIQAARIVVDKIGNVKVLVIGEGPCRKNLERLARQTKMDAHVIFTGYRDDVYDLINAMDIFVLSSLHEGIPTVLLEAMALQKPIISTDVGGVPEIITDGETGFLVPPKNPSVMADRIIYVLRNLKHANRVASQAKVKAEKEYTASHQADHVYSIYSTWQAEVKLCGGMNLK